MGYFCVILCTHTAHCALEVLRRCAI